VVAADTWQPVISATAGIEPAAAFQHVRVPLLGYGSEKRALPPVCVRFFLRGLPALLLEIWREVRGHRLALPLCTSCRKLPAVQRYYRAGTAPAMLRYSCYAIRTLSRAARSTAGP
jgi:hypothetical protein